MGKNKLLPRLRVCFYRSVIDGETRIQKTALWNLRTNYCQDNVLCSERSTREFRARQGGCLRCHVGRHHPEDMTESSTFRSVGRALETPKPTPRDILPLTRAHLLIRLN